MNFIENVIREAMLKIAAERWGALLDALEHSRTVDPFGYKPESFDPFGFTQGELYQLRVLLLRPLAYAYLQDLGVTLTQSAFDRKTSFDAYVAHYRRQPLLISTKPRIMLLTYTEWSDLAGVTLPDAPHANNDDGERAQR